MENYHYASFMREARCLSSIARDPCDNNVTFIQSRLLGRHRDNMGTSTFIIPLPVVSQRFSLTQRLSSGLGRWLRM